MLVASWHLGLRAGTVHANAAWWPSRITPCSLLQAAYQKLYSVRPCNPKLFAIREATCDLLYGAQTQPAAVTVFRQHPDSVVEVGVFGRLDVLQHCIYISKQAFRQS